jgi:hypothetical protein
MSTKTNDFQARYDDALAIQKRARESMEIAAARLDVANQAVAKLIAEFDARQRL